MQLSLPIDRLTYIVEGCVACGLDFTLRFLIPRVQERFNAAALLSVYQTMEETYRVGPPKDVVGMWFWTRVSEEDFIMFELRFGGIVDYLVQR